MNFKKAKELHTHACKNGYENACTNLENLKNQEQDTQGRLEKLMQACTLENNSACEAIATRNKRTLSKIKILFNKFVLLRISAIVLNRSLNSSCIL